MLNVVVKYPFTITPHYLSLIDKNNPKDPIRLQCVPSREEGNVYIEVHDDPPGEEADTSDTGACTPLS